VRGENQAFKIRGSNNLEYVVCGDKIAALAVFSLI
jgi:hypothetical protein